MNTKFFIILIVIIALGIGGFFVYRNISVPEIEEETPVFEEKTGEKGVPEEQEEEQTALPGETSEEAVEETKEEVVEEKIVGPADITQLTFMDMAEDPTWSPDGSQIIFRGRSGNEIGLYLINSDGTGLTKIGPSGYDQIAFNPSWSPVSNKIVCHEPENKGIYLIDLDGDRTEKVKLTDQPAQLTSWSPDGEKIAYNVFYNQYQSSSIWAMNADGSKKTRLTTDEDGFCTGPSFSHDGSKIVYVKGVVSYAGEGKAQQDPNEIWVMNSDGSNKHKIYDPEDSTQFICQRAWNKNNKILFTRFWRQKSPQVWVINPDGTNPKAIARPIEGMFTDTYDDAVWDNSGIKVAVTKIMADRTTWQVATFSWK
jgi:Tol biopolymer transport system component